MQKWEKFSKEQLEEIISNAKTKTEILIKLGYKNNGHTKYIDRIAERYNIDISHLIKKEIIGNKYGKLTVLTKTKEKTKNGSFKYLCRCDCGNQLLVDGVELRRNRAISCGCIRSRGEAKIQKILTDLGYDYQLQYTFKDLKGQGNGFLKFDFGILKNKALCCLIEYQGKQHYEATDYFGGQDNLIYQRKNDEIKKEYCKINHIPLIEIPYWDFDKIDNNYVKEKIDEYYN